MQWFIYNFGLMGPWTRCFQYQWVQLQIYESQTLFLMTSLQYYCIPGLAWTRWHKNLCAKDAGCAGNKITVHVLGMQTLPSLHIYVGSDQFWGFKIFNFNIVWVFRKMNIFWGMKKLWILQNWTIWTPTLNIYLLYGKVKFVLNAFIKILGKIW